ncbi:MAG: glycerol-3-phosphate dehydrogenase [Lentisphaeria bacterium]|nr:glycerol-3-phosphate dehydrogenase [Lentisphaeria bacterium]
MSIITIIGSGMMGSALAFPASENGHTVRLTGTPLDREIIEHCRRHGRHPKFEQSFTGKLEYYQFEEAAEALKDTELVICGVSSFGVEWFADSVLPILPQGVPVLSVTKGLLCREDGSLQCYPDYWAERLAKLGKDNELCAIGGPCTSYELTAHDHSLVAFCGRNRATLEHLKQLMSTDYYHVIVTTDVIGIESAVALKNGYALGIALTIGENFKRAGNETELHYNSQAGVFLQASREMRKLIAMQGGSEESYFVGIGDLYVTVYGGRTRKVGILLGEGYTIDEALEKLQGVTLESLVVAGRVAKALRIKAQRGELDLKDFPLLMHVDSIVTDKQPVNIPWREFADR